MNDFINLFIHNPKTVFAISVALPYITRAYYALKNGGGLKGVWRSIWSGTNTPKSNEIKDLKFK